MILNIPKAEACALRKAIRRSILINSHQALLHRIPLAGQEVLMGGIVAEKRELVELSRSDGPCRVSYLAPSPIVEASAKGDFGFENSSFLSLGRAIELTIYDFSGSFEISGFAQDREVRKKISRIQTGEVVYISGVIIPLNDATGYCLQPRSVYSQDELLFYRGVFEEEYQCHRKKIRNILARNYNETAFDRLFYSRSNMDLIRLFRSRPAELNGCDYYWLCDVAYQRYRETLMPKFARATLKYFLIFSAAQTWDEVDPEEYFFDFYDELRGVVDFSHKF